MVTDSRRAECDAAAVGNLKQQVSAAIAVYVKILSNLARQAVKFERHTARRKCGECDRGDDVRPQRVDVAHRDEDAAGGRPADDNETGTDCVKRAGRLGRRESASCGCRKIQRLPGGHTGRVVAVDLTQNDDNASPTVRNRLPCYTDHVGRRLRRSYRGRDVGVVPAASCAEVNRRASRNGGPGIVIANLVYFLPGVHLVTG